MADYINSNAWARKGPEKTINNLFKPLVLRKINNYLSSIGSPVSYNNLDDVPISRIYFSTSSAYRCNDPNKPGDNDGPPATATLIVEIPPVYGDNP